MATTDAKPGFRLPWSTDRADSGDPAELSADTPVDAPVDATVTDTVQDDPAMETETPAMIDAAPASTDQEAAVAPEAATESSSPAHEPAAATPSAPARKPNKFMADLTKAMQAAAETTREETLARLSTDAKAFIESIHATSATEATELRKLADDDVAAIREWSKAEIARIREETDERISHRKDALEHEIEAHAGAIEARIERVQARVNAFETEMAEFFERLLAEDDPTRFAAMAESLPEPPPLDAATIDAWAPPVEPTTAPEPATAEAAAFEPPVAEATATIDTTDAATETVEPSATTDDAPAAEAVTDASPVEADATVEPSAADSGDLFGLVETPTEGEPAADDPRLAMLSQSPDFAAAEAEAAAFEAGDGTETGDDVPVLADDAVAARIAGLVPAEDAAAADTEIATTRVVVTGLVSVASIAGFKRNLSRAAGVQSVGVSSGPDGEFVFAVGHGADISLKDVIPTLPGYAARVTGEAEGELTVAARDPEEG